jgi:hypothetical protein
MINFTPSKSAQVNLLTTHLGSITQWGEVSKVKKDRSKSKAKDTVTTTLGDSANGSRASRGGRSAQDGGRGGRGRGNDRGTDRGRGSRGRGAASANTNGTRAKDTADLSVPTTESSAWDTAASKPEDTSEAWETTGATKSSDTWGATAAEAVATTAAVASSVIPTGVKKSWASMFAAPPPPKKEPTPVHKYAIASLAAVTLTNFCRAPPPAPESEEKNTSESSHSDGLPPAKVETPVKLEEDTPVEAPAFEPEIPITPSKDELTESNVELVLDTSNPAPTATAASTAASSWDPRSGAASGTPYSALQHSQQAIRPPTSGFVASALKATGAAQRTPSYQRRVLDQEEAVRMPGNREVDRAAVQFGAFNLNGSGDDDVDGDREEAETRAQPPQHSPVAPRASLPPAPAQPEGLPTPKDAPGLPTPQAAPGLPAPNTLPGGQTMAQQGSQGGQQYSQYGRYGGSGGQDQSTFGQKPYDPFSQQASTTQSQFEGYPAGQSSAQPQQPAQSSAPSEYSQYFTADQQRNAYQNYYGQQYNQQQGAPGQPQQDGTSASGQRAFSGYNAPQTENSQFPQSSAQSSQSRYATAGEAQNNSGHTTPNPVAQSQQQPGQAQQAHPSQPQAQPGQYPYGHPYYSSPYYAAYMNQYQQGYGGQGNYPAAGPYGAKGGMYNQHQGYGMTPQAPYDHAASPATGGFGQSALHGRDSALGGGLGDYGRTGSQPSQTAQPLSGSGAFGGIPDAFGRGSSYQGQGQQYGQQGSQQGAGDDLKPFGDAKSTTGPSPLLSQAARPGSAANSAPGQSVLPPPQSTQQGYGGYPSHLQQQHAVHGSQTGSQYGGLGASGGHQATGQGHQSSQYGGYGQGFGGNSYYGNNQQQRGGWGNNYGH